MPKYDVIVPLVFEELEADSAEDAVVAIKKIVTINHRRRYLVLSDMDFLDWHPKVEKVNGKYCITLSDVIVHADLEEVTEDETAAATA